MAALITSNFLFILLLFSRIATVTPYPTGISIGHRYLSSAYYTDTDELILITRIEANTEWQAIYSLIPTVNRSSLFSIFRTTLQQIKIATEETLNEIVNINSIVLPSHFNSLQSILKVAAIAEGLMTVEQQATNSLNADRLAYNLDSCWGLMPSNETCTLRDYHLVMIFNYEPDRLSVAMIEVDEYICNPHKVEHYPQFGEMTGNIRHPAQQQELNKTLDHFLEDLVKVMAHKWPDAHNVLQYLRAVVLSGEASDKAMQEMRSALATALPQYQDKSRVTLDPHWVGAIGAAQRARHIVLNPEFMESAIHCPGCRDDDLDWEGWVRDEL